LHSSRSPPTTCASMAEARRSVKFHLEQSDQTLTVVNTFLHLEEKKDRSPRKCKTAPESIICAAVEAMEDDDETEDELEFGHVNTYDGFENETVEDDELTFDHHVKTHDNFEDLVESKQLASLVPVVPLQFAAPVVFCAAFPQRFQEPVPAAPRLLGRMAQSTEVVKSKEAPPKIVCSEGLPLECGLVNGKEQLTWSVDGRTLDSLYKQKLSPEFHLDLPGVGLQPFRLMILAKETKGKGGRSFRKAAGFGRIFVKCETSLPQNTPGIAFHVTVSGGAGGALSKGPFLHQFFDQNCCALQGKAEDWNLLAAVDESSKRFEVCVQVVDYDVQ